MPTRHRTIHIPVGGRTIAGTLVAPSTIVPGVMLVHGWDGSQAQYIERAHQIAARGCICLTFDLRGHANDREYRNSVTRDDNLADMVAAYDLLVGHPAVDASTIVVAGSSYGGYLAAVLSSLRPVRWLALRAPALYRDEDWMVPKHQLNKADVAAYRAKMISAEHNRALAASAAFRGDVLLVESEHDAIVPHPVMESYLAAFKQAHSMTYRVIKEADHGLSQKVWGQAYTNLLVNWVDEMVQGAKQEGEAKRKKRIAAQVRREEAPTPPTPGPGSTTSMHA